MISYYIYDRHEPYISDSDDFVNMMAQIQIVLLYLALVSIYTSTHSDQNGVALADIAKGQLMSVFLVVILFSFLAAVYVTIIDLGLAAHIIPTLKTMKTSLRKKSRRDCLFFFPSLLLRKKKLPSPPSSHGTVSSLGEEQKDREAGTVDGKYYDDPN